MNSDDRYSGLPAACPLRWRVVDDEKDEGESYTLFAGLTLGEPLSSSCENADAESESS